MSRSRMLRMLVMLWLAAPVMPAFGQQTGSLSGTVVDTGGGVLPGVTVEARSDVLPTPRVVTTEANGDYRIPALPPGNYTVTFTLSGMQTVTRQAQVQLAQDTVVNSTLGVGGVEETVTVTATASLIDRETSTIKSGVSNEQIMALPVGQEYRDLVRLIPGVQFTQDEVRGPSAGGSGQDNVYQFDGVNVTLPLFGTLSAEPASHDIAQVTTIKGGARAVDFDRSGGFTIDSVSKSGTNRFAGQLGFQLQSADMSADREDNQLSRFEQDQTWTTLSLGGPIVPERVFFYASYYRPTRTRDNRANVYGELPKYESKRHEGFGKVTYTPLSSVLLNFSYRHSNREENSDLFEENQAPTTGTGEEARLRIFTSEGSWILNTRSHITFKYTYFANETLGRPDFISSAVPTSDIGAQLDVADLAAQGRLTVPQPVAGNPDHNAFVQPIIDRYGFLSNGVLTGGGIAGFGAQFDNNDFFRNSGQIGYNIIFGSDVTHDVHLGYQRYVDSEDLVRSSNGWGLISVPGGRTNLNGIPIFYTGRYQRQTTGQAAPIKSYYESQSLEINDRIGWKNWTFNLGLLVSNDTLFGQGLREDSAVLSGYTSAPGNKYEMYDIPFSKMIQPRLGVTWAYNGNDTIYGSYARYNPAASSLPRAASWDRNLIGTFIDAHFDRNGVLFAAVPVGSSSGKLFVEDMTPRTIDEFLVGTAKQFTPNWSGRLYGRYREGSHFWEDTNNDARIRFNPPADIPSELYIPDLTQRLAQIGSGSTYVIAELDDAYTKYQEVTLESEWRSEKLFVRGSYTWSHYYGNFDQDNSTDVNDANVFIGSSFIADGAGRQLWNFKDGDLRGDRPHMFKLYGFYMLNWNATVGAYVVAQSGQPWEVWNYEIYRPLVGTSTSDVNRYAEPAGSRRSDAHWQMDLNYTQNFRLGNRLNLQIATDLFNLFDEQTGFNIEPKFHDSDFGQPRDFFDPRRLQIAARLQF